MNKLYKVQFSHVFDVVAENEEEAVKLGDVALDEALLSRTLHYHEDSDPTVYDVTDTDDPHSEREEKTTKLNELMPDIFPEK